MNTRKLFLPVIAVLFGLAVSAFAQTKTTEATVAKVSGAATVTLPGGSTVAVVVGMKVPQGATLTTGADGDVLLQSHTNTVATIKPNSVVSVDELSVTTSGSTVTEEVTTLNVKSGNLVAALDPAKRNVNNYKVKTPKGVAAARGTTFSVVVNGTEYTVTTTSGGVSFAPVGGGAGYTIGAGQTSSSATGGTPVNIASMPTSTPAEQAAKDAAVAEMTNVLAAVAVAATVGVIPASELQAAVTNAIAAAPESASTIVQTVTTVAPTQAATVQTAVTNSTALSAEQRTSATTAVQTGVTNSSSTTTTTTTTTTPAGKTETKTEVKTDTTTAQPLDVSVISRGS